MAVVLETARNAATQPNAGADATSSFTSAFIRARKVRPNLAEVVPAMGQVAPATIRAI
jgi:hypothetical protein